MELYIFAIKHDWPVLLPILVCSIIAIAVSLERMRFYRRNRAGVGEFIDAFQAAILRSVADGRKLAERKHGLIPHLAAEGAGIMAEHPDSFEPLYEVRASLASRDLHRGLAWLGTIATICPYLGLFGTVARILIVFGEMSQSTGGSDSGTIMFGIGSALIATAFGLLVAMLAVAMNNYLHAVADNIVADFEVIKLICMSVKPGGHAHGTTTHGTRHRLDQAWEI
jgi:biopolymer transport protein ExbB